MSNNTGSLRETFEKRTVDVADRAQVESAMQAVREKFGPISILVTSAGVDGYAVFTELSLDSLNRVLAINLSGVHLSNRRRPNALHRGQFTLADLQL